MDVILGVHCSMGVDGRYTADGNVCVVVDGTPVFAIGEERITRNKYDGAFAASADYALESLGLEISDVRAVAISTFGRPDRIGNAEHDDVVGVVRAALGDGPRFSVIPSHHQVHALSAVAQAPYERAIVAVIDNEGSIIGDRRYSQLWQHRLERTSYFLLDGNSLVLVARDHDGPGEVGYGKAYSKLTRYVGFQSYQESGKTMALAAFGDVERYGRLELFTPGADGRTVSRLRNTADGCQDLATFFAEAGFELPPPRRAGEPLDPRHVDLAAWGQAELEGSVSARLAELTARHAVRTVCGAGGVFLNSVMNRRLQDCLDTPDVFVPPSPADQGLALGAAAWLCWQESGRIPHWGPQPYLGTEFDEPAINSELARHEDLCITRCDDPAAAAAAEIAAGGIVGWFQGRSEYGPRALGNRSILADPRNPWARELLNNLVKHREWFRPYAPVATESSAPSTFDLRSPVPHMMHVAPTLPAARTQMPSGVHVDSSARLQTVSETQNQLFHELITRFCQETGSLALINTSLNVDGMPIVESPADAIECLRRAPGLDSLYVGPMRVAVSGRPGRSHR